MNIIRVAVQILIYFHLPYPLSALLPLETKLRGILNSESYSRYIPPKGWDYIPLVTVVPELIRIHNIDDEKSQMTVQLSTRLTWIDERLVYTSVLDKHNAHLIPYLTLDYSETALLVWTPIPGFTIENEITREVQQEKTNLRIYPNGTLVLQIYITISLGCHFHLEDFPFDSQSCKVIMTNPDISMKLENHGNDTSGDLGRLNYKGGRFLFTEMNWAVENCSSTYDSMSLTLTWNRLWGLYMVSAITPATMCVGLTWTQFWLGEEIGIRLSLAMSILLSLTTMTQTYSLTLPQVSYTRAIDVWTGMCLANVGMCILAITTTAFLMKRKGRKIHDVTEIDDDRTKRKYPWSKDPFWLDIICGTILPLGFALIAVVFYFVYVQGRFNPSIP